MNKNYNIQEELDKLKNINSYTMLSNSFIDEISAHAVLMKHNKTKAKLLLMLTKDDNKVFTIGFRTPSENSTGVAHILEHSVLCGSKNFPCKDPFVELVKGSLNTFLNAMTYMDRTVYPVASLNDADFHNLMNVYLDAVFYPNIYTEDKIFKQEGWHYELLDKDSDLNINGVVYNEMKGAFSSADSVMERAISKTLFENHPYGEESGGDPDFIPELTYEYFLDFHSKYYHPSNSFIYLYGNIDMAKKLDFIDKEYLDKFEYREIDSSIKDSVPLTNTKKVEYDYSISDNESDIKAAYLSLHKMVGGEFDPVKAMAFKVLEYILIEMPGAILTEALIKANIGEEISGGYDYGIKEPYFSIIAKNASKNRNEEFIRIINEKLISLVENGIDKTMLKAAINMYEFRAREADYGNYPKGLLYGLDCFNTWIYDEDPFMNLRYNVVFDTLKKEIDNGYFENLIKKDLIENTYAAEIILNPVKNLTAKKDELLREKLKNIKESLSNDELDTIIRETKALKQYQEEPSKPEDLDKIPVLKREDINVAADKLIWEEKQFDLNKNIPFIFSNIFTSKIAYLKLSFDIDFASEKELFYIALLREILAYIDTKNYTYAELSTAIDLNIGGLGFALESFSYIKESDKSNYRFSINSKALYNNIDKSFELIKEVIENSKLDDISRIKDILLEVRAGLKSKILSAGHISALTRAGSYISKDALFSELTKGISYYKFIESLCENFDDKKEEIVNYLKEVSSKIFRKSTLLVHLVADNDGLEEFSPLADNFISQLNDFEVEKAGINVEYKEISEGFTSASQVNYIARYGNFKKHGYEYTGALKVLKVLLSYDYLWTNIRVIGGAYGCSAVFGRTGNSGFTSYRDPNVSKTDEVYLKIADFVENFNADEREMTKAVIGAISELDTPMNPLSKGLAGLFAFISGITDEDLQKERDEILKITSKDIKELAPLIKAVLSDNIMVAIGNEEKILKEKDKFDKIEHLYN